MSKQPADLLSLTKLGRFINTPLALLLPLACDTGLAKCHPDLPDASLGDLVFEVGLLVGLWSDGHMIDYTGDLFREVKLNSKHAPCDSLSALLLGRGLLRL